MKLNKGFIILFLICNVTSLSEIQHPFFPLIEGKRFIKLQPLVRFRNGIKRPYFQERNFHNPAFFAPEEEFRNMYTDNSKTSPTRVGLSLSDLLSVINNEEASKRFKTLLTDTKVQSIYFGIRR